MKYSAKIKTFFYWASVLVGVTFLVVLGWVTFAYIFASVWKAIQ